MVVALKGPLGVRGNSNTEFKTHKFWSEPVEQDGYPCFKD